MYLLALFKSHSTPSHAAVQPTDERNWFGSKGSHNKKMAKEAAAGQWAGWVFFDAGPGSKWCAQWDVSQR
jgi:hypothetical protein